MIRMIGIAMIAVLMGASLESCSKDENPEKGEDGVVINEKKLVEIIETYEDGDSYSTKFQYDNLGRLIDVNGVAYYIWNDNSIKEILGTSSYEYSMHNGLISSDARGTYTYDNNGKFLLFEDHRDDQYQYKYQDYTRAYWDGDKLASVTLASHGRSENFDYTFTYESSCKKGYFPNIGSIISPESTNIIAWAHPEIIGLRMTHLPTTITKVGTARHGTTIKSNTIFSYTYQFDKDGYISKIVEKCNTTYSEENGEPQVRNETISYTLIWK